jgi:fatty acid desaturase
VFPSLWLWLPFRTYRESHLLHHRTPRLTDPFDDPESYLVSRARWQRTSRTVRGLITAYHTVPGRLLAGPPVAAWNLLRAELPRLARGDRDSLKAWALHGAGCALTLAWVVGVCRIPLLAYLLLYAFAGTSLTLLRSFAEHRAATNPGARTAVVEAGPLMSLLYLNNNLHVVHHDHPGLPWYRIPALYRERRDRILRSNGGYRFAGYGDVIRRHWRRPAHRPVYDPGSATRVFQAGAAIG